mmetsp:Transcript_80247/g.221906  ORF Transcript_80247/g.221906 Transcript_80247/m.221906 type:complete len:358 (+) Transcript_80247:67-1140(+)
MFCGKFCACCPPPLPAPLTHQQQPRPLGSVALTVRLLSGELLMEMGVGDHVRADELKLEVEVKASAWLAKAGCCIRALLWGATELGGARTLSELGMGGKEEVVAVCARSIEGDFEKFRPGCPTCDAYSTVTRMRFELSGVASLSFTCQGAEETRTFRYTLGEVEEGDGPRGLRRRLRLDEATRVFEGWLEFDAADPIQRRVRVEGLDLVPRMPLCAPRDAPAELDLEDLRALQLRGKDEARMRKRLLFQSYDIKGFWGAEREEDVPLWDPKHVEEERYLFQRVFARPRYQRERFRRDRRPKPRYGRRSRCFCGLGCQGRGSHWICRSRGDVRAEAARARSCTRRAERALKVAVYQTD